MVDVVVLVWSNTTTMCTSSLDPSRVRARKTSRFGARITFQLTGSSGALFSLPKTLHAFAGGLTTFRVLS